MFARSDRYYIRESEIETSISVRLLIDASASMNHEDSGITKIEYARYLAASLAYLANLQGDATGLYVFQNNNMFSLPSRKDPRHLSRIFHQLEQIRPSATFTEPVHYKSIFSGTGKKELLIFVTDYYEQHGEITKLLQSLAANKHEVIVFHLMGKNEMGLDFTGYATLEDLETGETVKVDAVKSRRQYKERLDAYLTSIKNELLSRDIFYELITMDEPMDKALLYFLNRRNKLRG